MADQSSNLPYAEGMNYGVGVNLLNGKIPGKAVDPGEEKGPSGALGQTVKYNITLINSFEELYSSIGIAVEANGQFGLFNASGKFKYANESKFNSQGTFLLARCVVENAFTQVEDATIKPEASKLLVQGRTDLFQRRYGDGYVRGQQTGGEFFAVISLVSSSQEEQTSIATSLRAKYGGLFASAALSVELDTNTKNKLARSQLSISTYQRGGLGDEQTLTDDIEAVMKRLKAFPVQVKNNPVVYEVQVASYETLALPDGPNPIDIQAQKDSLVDYARIQVKLNNLRNEIEFVQLHPDYFESPPDNTTLNLWQDFVTDETNKLIRQASKCIENPVDGCPLLAFKLPSDYRQSQRKINSIDIKAAADSYPDDVVLRNVDTPKDFTISTRLVTKFQVQTFPRKYFGVGLALMSTSIDRGVYFLKGVGDTGQSVSCYAFNNSSDEVPSVINVGKALIFFSEDEVYLRMSKKGDQLLDLSISRNGQDWEVFAEFVNLTSLGFTPNDSYKLALCAYSTGNQTVSGRFFDTNVTEI
jgi:hypothetical protein